MNQVAMRRREFLAQCALAGATVFIAGCVSLVTHPVPVSGGQVRLALSAFPDLANPEGAIKIQPQGLEDPIYVLATSTGEYRAVSPICTHRGCTVDVSGARLVCPCHGSTYDREGQVLRGPAERALTRYPLSRSGDTLVIEIGGS